MPEYASQAGLPVVINRCIIAGPGQFGKVEQGVFTLWVARHYFGRPLKYMGFGRQGVRFAICFIRTIFAIL